MDELSCNINKSHPGYQTSKKLDNILLRFPNPQVMVVVADLLDAKTLSFWAHELDMCLPELLVHGSVVTVECK